MATKQGGGAAEGHAAENDLKVGTVALTSGRAGEGVLVRKNCPSAAPGGPHLPEERQPSEATSGWGEGVSSCTSCTLSSSIIPILECFLQDTHRHRACRPMPADLA